MEMKFYSPLTAEFFPDEPDWEDESYNEYEGYPMDGHDLLQYADAVDEAVKKDIADFNGDLMQYYHEDDSVRSKVVSAVPSVEICGNKLCGCLTVELKEPLLDDEQTVLCTTFPVSTATAGARALSREIFVWMTARWLFISGRKMDSR